MVRLWHGQVRVIGQRGAWVGGERRCGDGCDQAADHKENRDDEFADILPLEASDLIGFA